MTYCGAGGEWIFGLSACIAQAGGGLDLTIHNPRCFRMALMISLSSMLLMMRMVPWHFGQMRGSTSYIF
jgi:hypothetical protein